MRFTQQFKCISIPFFSFSAIKPDNFIGMNVELDKVNKRHIDFKTFEIWAYPLLQGNRSTTTQN